MRIDLFEFPSFKYEISDWNFKKKGLLKRIKEEKLTRKEYQSYETDRYLNKKSYIHYFQDLIRPELDQFCKEAKVRCSMTDCWTVRYQKGDYQEIHNHKSWGFSGILYVEYDPNIHNPTIFVAPWQDPRSDRTILKYPEAKEGSMIIVPSCTLHYARPNLSRKQRTIVSFDLLPADPASINQLNR